MNKSRNNKAVFAALAGVIAALYVVLTLVSSAFGLSGGPVQVRISEALTILPVFTPAAIPGLAIGCLLANIITGSVIYDIIFGTVATLLGAVGTYLLRRLKYISWLPPVIFNALIIPPVLVYAYGAEEGYLLITLSVSAGEVVSCGLLGIILMKILEKTNLLNIGGRKK